MKIAASVPAPSAAALAAAIGVVLVAGLAFAPPLAAQDQTAKQLDTTMEQDVDPPPPIDTDAQAAADAERSDANWKKLDTDRDGRISRSESSVDPDFDSNFETMDTNHDGYISRSEMNGHAPTDVPKPGQKNKRP